MRFRIQIVLLEIIFISQTAMSSLMIKTNPDKDVATLLNKKRMHL